MRYVIFFTCALYLSACERVNPPSDRHDAGPVQPPDDGGLTDGGAGLDARTSRPGAGPLEPDLTIPCEETQYNLTTNPTTGAVSKYSIWTARWTESELPYAAWVCYVEPYVVLPCAENCERVGGPTEVLCSPIFWQWDGNGNVFHVCRYHNARDDNGDGVFEPADPFIGQYLAIIR